MTRFWTLKTDCGFGLKSPTRRSTFNRDGRGQHKFDSFMVDDGYFLPLRPYLMSPLSSRPPTDPFDLQHQKTLKP